MEHVYVLECDGSKYFVGKTNDICKTFNEHLNKQHDLTKPYTSIKIIEINNTNGMFDEQSKTLEYMTKYGHDNVRGGPYINATLTKEQKRSINASIVSATKNNEKQTINTNQKYTWNKKKTYGVKWTEEEEKLLIKEMAIDKNYKKIAQSHNRTEIAIQARVRLLVNKEIKNGKTEEEACKCLNITDKEYKFLDRFTYTNNK